jgi:hypothetical protein
VTGNFSGNDIEAQSAVFSLSRGTISRIVKAFFYIYFGLFASVVLLFSMSFTSLISFVQIPSYVIGSAAVFYGAILLHTDRALRESLKFSSGMLIFFAAMHIYFAPFITWWFEKPAQLIFFVNVLFFVMVNILILFVLNLMVARIYRLMDLPDKVSEAYFAAAAVFFLMLVPFVVWVGGAIFRMIRYQSDFVYEVMYGSLMAFELCPSFSSLLLFKKTTLAIVLLFMLPLPHTLAVVWRAGKICRGKLRKQNETS